MSCNANNPSGPDKPRFIDTLKQIQDRSDPPSFQLTIGGLTKQEAMDMVESLYGSVMWSWEDEGLISYPKEHAAVIKQKPIEELK